MKLRLPLLALLFLTASGGDLQPVPALTGPVVDEAHVVSPGDRAMLDNLARNVRAQDDGNGVQLGFLLVPSIGYEPIEDFSIRVAEAWKIGTKGADNGLLFVVATNDHKMRLEVGGGLEGKLPDVLAGRIVDETLKPAFRTGRFGAGLLAGAQQALSILQVGPGALPQAHRPADGGGIPMDLVVWLLIIAFIVVINFLGRGRRGGFWIGGGGFGGGGFGGGSGGGWSGGGGGFSGGGASGSW